MSEKKPFHVHCHDCSHEWVLFYTPINMALMKHFKNVICPVCHGKKIFVGKNESRPSEPVRPGQTAPQSHSIALPFTKGENHEAKEIA